MGVCEAYIANFTVTGVKNLSASDVFTPATTTPYSLLNRSYSRISTVFEHQILCSHFINVTTQTIKH